MADWQVVDGDYDALLGKFPDMAAGVAADFRKIIELLDSEDAVNQHLDDLKRQTVAKYEEVNGAARAASDCLLAELEDDEKYGVALHRPCATGKMHTSSTRARCSGWRACWERTTSSR